MLERVWIKSNPLGTVVGNANWYSQYREEYGDSLKKKKKKKKKLGPKLPYDPEILLLVTYPQETKIEKGTCTPMFIAVLFTIDRTWKQPRCPLTHEWIKKLWYVYTWNIHAHAQSLQSCPTLCDPMDCSLLVFSVHRITQL